MHERGVKARNCRDAEVAGTPEIAARRASCAVGFPGGAVKPGPPGLTACRAMRAAQLRSRRTSAAFGGRLRFASGAERKIFETNTNQELKNEPSPCLISSADPSTYQPGKSVRTTRATAHVAGWPPRMREKPEPIFTGFHMCRKRCDQCCPVPPTARSFLLSLTVGTARRLRCYGCSSDRKGVRLTRISL